MSTVTPASGGIFDFALNIVQDFVETAQETFGPAFNKAFKQEATKAHDQLENTPTFPAPSAPKFGR